MVDRISAHQLGLKEGEVERVRTKAWICNSKVPLYRADELITSLSYTS